MKEDHSMALESIDQTLDIDVGLIRKDASHLDTFSRKTTVQ